MRALLRKLQSDNVCLPQSTSLRGARTCAICTMKDKVYDGFGLVSFFGAGPFGLSAFSVRCFSDAACQRSVSARMATVCSFMMAWTIAATAFFGRHVRAAAILAA